MSDYPEQYLTALRLFNEEDFFECHDVLEELWAETMGAEKKFYQGLIQLSISLFHFGNENYGGAIKLYDSSRKYLEPYRPEFQGINIDLLLLEHELCFAELRASPNPFESHPEMQDELVPKIPLPADAEE